MFLAHLPAGYLLSRALSKGQKHRNALIATAMVASVVPDLDLFWFYLVSDRQTAHHAYFFHWPLFWVGLALLAWLIVRAARLKVPRFKTAEPFILMALAGTLLHMVLDSVAAEIYWLKPFSNVELNLVHVDAQYDWWVWNFVLHWTFLIELTITVIAAITFWRDKRDRGATISQRIVL